MVCDDDQDLRQCLVYNIILVGSGENCIEKFIEEQNHGNKIHLILLDYRLGDMMGDSVARTIKEDEINIFLSISMIVG
jgi:CheY-like chemotaxis protein